jgi:hypothetical protein
MVWQALTRKEAAEVAGLTEHALYCALRKPHVMAHYLSLCEVLRLSGRARRIHRLEAMVEQDENKAAVVNASIALDRPSESAMQSSASQAVPGITIHIHETPASPPAKIIDATPSARVPAIDRQGD